ncbi:ribonuclease H-like domain-containing protein [Pisolithus thermaeus]|nr:ribonuclease H-like domain-containing protein [Pisolithus thermaeus]
MAVVGGIFWVNMVLKTLRLTLMGGHRRIVAQLLRTVARIVAVNTGPIVWVDCEMTGLDPKKDKLLEIAVLITNGNLELVDDGLQFVIKTEKSALDNMDEWCKTHHGQSGLTQACLASPHTRDHVSHEVLQYIKRWVPEQRTGVLAGNSVHVDRMFLTVEMPEVVDWLHYRIIDVSSIKELCRRWYPNLEFPRSSSGGSHRALDDIRCSIKELTWYRQNIFRKSLPV